MKKWSDCTDVFPKSLLEELYVEKQYSKEQIAKELHICVCTVRKLLNHYGIQRNNNQIVARNNTLYKGKAFRDLCTRISAEDLYKRYILDNTPYNQLEQELGVTSYTLDKLLRHYGIHKSRSQSSSIVLQSKLSKYGPDNFNNWQKGHSTRIKNYGSLDASYQAGIVQQKKTNLEKYGVECYFSVDTSETARHKKHSRPNELFNSYLTRHGIDSIEREFTLHTKSFDFRVDNNLIEINPSITHNSTFCPFGTGEGLDKSYHSEKSKLAKDFGFRCIHVWDWDNLDKIVMQLTPKHAIPARKCLLSELSKEQCDHFLNNYHLQNTCRGQEVRLGLFYNSELVQVMTFGKPRYNKEFDYELLRLCSKPGYAVTGGSEKLFKKFLSDHPGSSVISYCDLSKFSGAVYQKLGMTLLRTTKPTRHWYNLKTRKHFTDAFVRQHGADQLVGTFGGKGTSNVQLLRENGFVEVYDCGQAVYIYK